ADTVYHHSANNVFKKGHRIMVQIQSTWFPLYDRNPQKFVPNIFAAKDADYQKATHTIYRTRQYPSSVAIDVLPAGAAPGLQWESEEIHEHPLASVWICLCAYQKKPKPNCMVRLPPLNW